MAERSGLAMAVGRVVVGAARGVARLLPERARKALDDRFFGAVFQVTRVTNDNYGWRPDDAPGPVAPPRGASGGEG